MRLKALLQVLKLVLGKVSLFVCLFTITYYNLNDGKVSLFVCLFTFIA